MSSETTNVVPVKLPEFPDEMPMELCRDEHWLRNVIGSLNGFSCVDIHFESDVNELGEERGQWEMTIETSRKQCRARHSHFLNALWFVFVHATAADDAAYLERENARAAAMAKLSTEEKRLLGLR